MCKDGDNPFVDTLRKTPRPFGELCFRRFDQGIAITALIFLVIVNLSKVETEQRIATGVYTYARGGFFRFEEYW